MKHFSRRLGCVLAVLSMSAGQATANSAHPYQQIAVKNAFKLRGPQLIVPPSVEPIPLPGILLQGFTTISASKKALFKTVAKPGEMERFHVLAEGQAVDGIVVLLIDEASRRVTFNNHGTVQELTLEKPSAGPTHKPPLLKPPLPVLIPPPTMAPEEQVLMMEVERERTKEQVATGELPPLPPTELTPPDSPGMPRDIDSQ